MKHFFLSLIAAVLFAVVARADAPGAFELKPIGPGAYAAIDREGKAGANAGFVVGKDAVLVVDTFFDPAASEALLGEIRRLTKVPVRYVVNTHHHIDHTGGNAVFAKAGATVIAQRNARDWLKSENLRLLGGEAITPERRAAVEALKAPDVVYDGTLDIDLGGRVVRLRHPLGHTGGDTVVWVKDAKVVFMGDLFWRHASPNLIDALVADWIPTLDRIAKLGSDVTFVPGHGDVGTLADVRAFRGYLADLSAFAGEASGDNAEADVLARMSAKYGDWGFFKSLGVKGVGHMLAERAGTKRTPSAVADPTPFN
jgi:glyoxylase-like metal-dependent hydrolase (beta-lactamase superfamily II)